MSQDSQDGPPTRIGWFRHNRIGYKGTGFWANILEEIKEVTSLKSIQMPFLFRRYGIDGNRTGNIILRVDHVYSNFRFIFVFHQLNNILGKNG